MDELNACILFSVPTENISFIYRDVTIAGEGLLLAGFCGL